MYAVKLNHGNRFFGKYNDARKFQLQMFSDKKIRLDIYKQVNNPLTGYGHFEKIV